MHELISVPFSIIFPSLSPQSSIFCLSAQHSIPPCYCTVYVTSEVITDKAHPTELTDQYLMHEMQPLFKEGNNKSDMESLNHKKKNVLHFNSHNVMQSKTLKVRKLK